jgi:pimeloyl-ACP methyl ester carboxylesterase
MGSEVTYYKTLVRSGYAPANGLRMYYEIHGGGRPLVTIHPFLGMANVFPSLVAKHQIIAMDLQGHGRTADVDRPFSFQQDADDVAALLSHLGVERADVFGESFGGTIALQLALRHPHLVGRVATYGSMLGSIQDSVRPEMLAQFSGLTPDDRSVAFQREAYERVAPEPSHWPQLFIKSRSIEWSGFKSEELQRIQSRVLLAVGDHDLLGPRLEAVLAWYRLLPNAELCVIPNAGHFILNHDPGRLLHVIQSFLDEPCSHAVWATPASGYQPGETR